MKYILLLSILFSSPIIAQTSSDTTANRSVNVQASQPKKDTVWVVQQPAKQQSQKIENEYSMSSGTQTLYIVMVALALIPLLFLL